MQVAMRGSQLELFFWVNSCTLENLSFLRKFWAKYVFQCDFYKISLLEKIHQLLTSQNWGGEKKSPWSLVAYDYDASSGESKLQTILLCIQLSY